MMIKKVVGKYLFANPKGYVPGTNSFIVDFRQSAAYFNKLLPPAR